MKLSSSLLKEHFRLAVVGGGTGGSAVAARFSRSLPAGQVAVIDGDPRHHYQPGWTLLGGGLIPAASVMRTKRSLLPKNVKLFEREVGEFQPANNSLLLNDGTEIGYDFLVIATGMQVEGLEEALASDGTGVCSIYRFDLAQRTYLELEKFKGGTAVFTFPVPPIKCPGAPQKICYLYIADEIFRRNGVRERSHLIFNNTLGVIFEVEKYARALTRVLEERGIEFNSRESLIKVDAKKRVATFQIVDANKQPTDQFKEVQYDLLHVAPPCTPVESLRKAAKSGVKLTDAAGWVKVDEKTLKSTEHANVFALGDCANTTNKKTAAAVAAQLRTLDENLAAAIAGRPSKAVEYTGYASCPLIVDSKHFNHEGPLETLPIDQSKPRRLYFWITRYFLLWVYWQLHVKGRWLGPATWRKILHLGRTQ
ncbi:Sulfide:quinone oxidoreductase, mitochondrial [Aphelenchoides fujianensis]|nr:Sulfide:quinone oxidoreductase, mitochondrial [Aphelenchoides fujianensis]